MTTTYEIRWIGGNCPVQAEGKIGGRLNFYFRARGDEWCLRISRRDPVCNPEWAYGEDYGTWPEAGWMEEVEARAFIDKAIKKFLAERKEKRGGR